MTNIFLTRIFHLDSAFVLYRITQDTLKSVLINHRVSLITKDLINFGINHDLQSGSLNRIIMAKLILFGNILDFLTNICLINLKDLI